MGLLRQFVAQAREAREAVVRTAGRGAFPKHQTPYIVPTSCLALIRLGKLREVTFLRLPVAISAELHMKQISRCTLLSAGSWLMSHDVRLFVGADHFFKADKRHHFSG